MKEILLMTIAVIGAVTTAWLGVSGGIYLWRDLGCPELLAVVIGMGLTAAALFCWFIVVSFLHELLGD